jgi:hypothetical protein
VINLATVIITDTTSVSKSRIQKVEEGLSFISSHFNPNEPIWPRTISTNKTCGKQIVVNSFEEAMKWFKAANFLDCRISAYPVYSDEYIRWIGIAFIPSLLLCDLDREHVTDEEFEAAAVKTCQNFKEILGANHTQLWTGSGYHFIQPQSVIMPLESIDDFKQFAEPSRRFLQFEECLMTDGKADQNHIRTVSSKNCMLRVPGSLNFGVCHRNDNDEVIGIPPEAEVRVIQGWDGSRPDVSHLIPRCYNWLKSIEIREMKERIEADKKSMKYRRWFGNNEKTTFEWIEKLLNKPIDTNRYYCVWRILAPYLINVRKLSSEEALDIIETWMTKCNSVKRLSFSIRKVKDVLKRVGAYYPIAWYNLEKDNKILFQKLKDEGVIY